MLIEQLYPLNEKSILNLANKINSSGTPTAESAAPKKKAEKKAASPRSVKAKKTADTSFETAPKKTKAVKNKAVSQKMKTTEKCKTSYIYYL